MNVGARRTHHKYVKHPGKPGRTNIRTPDTEKIKSNKYTFVPNIEILKQLIY